MDPTMQYFLLGAVGSLAPETVRLVTLAREGKQFGFSPFYVIASICLALIAGLIAVFLPSDNGRAALYTGISAPVLINSIAKKTAVKGAGRVKGGNGGSLEPQSRWHAFVAAL